jgi:hypothetical protein
MGWWPFQRKRAVIIDDPHVRGTRHWLGELQETCEKNFDNHAEGQRAIRQMQVEWTDAHGEEELADDLREGLDKRAFHLLRADQREWLAWLDHEDFWKPGWRLEPRIHDDES